MPLDFSSEREPMTAYSLAGLADVVLLLLIFFLLTSNFIPQMGIRVNLPEAQVATPSTAEYVNVSITNEGRFYVESDPVPREQLLSAIREVKGERTALVLRADREATVEQFAAVATAAQALRLRVLMATERPEQ